MSDLIFISSRFANLKKNGSYTLNINKIIPQGSKISLHTYHLYNDRFTIDENNKILVLEEYDGSNWTKFKVDFLGTSLPYNISNIDDLISFTQLYINNQSTFNTYNVSKDTYNSMILKTTNASPRQFRLNFQDVDSTIVPKLFGFLDNQDPSETTSSLSGSDEQLYSFATMTVLNNDNFYITFDKLQQKAITDNKTVVRPNFIIPVNTPKNTLLSVDKNLKDYYIELSQDWHLQDEIISLRNFNNQIKNGSTPWYLILKVIYPEDNNGFYRNIF